MTTSLATSRPMTLRSFTVAEIMTPKPLAFEKSLPIQTAFALLQCNRLDAAPLVDERHRLAGIVTVASCAAWDEFSLRCSPHAVDAKGYDKTTVWEISSPVVERVREDASAEEAINRLADRRVRRIYVVNQDDELVGVVSISDLIRHLTERTSRPSVSRTDAALLC